MTDYARHGYQDLLPDDWEKVWALNWQYPKTLRLLKRFESKGVVPYRRSYWDNGWIKESHLNSTFSRAGLPYRVFKTSFGSDAHRIGIVTPQKRSIKPRKLQLSSNDRQVVTWVLKTARAVVKDPSPKNLTALEHALKHRRLPSYS